MPCDNPAASRKTLLRLLFALLLFVLGDCLSHTAPPLTGGPLVSTIHRVELFYDSRGRWFLEEAAWEGWNLRCA